MQRSRQKCQKAVQWQSVGLQFKRICLTFDSRAAEHDSEKTYAAYSRNGGFECQLTLWWGNMGMWGKSPVSYFVYKQNHKSLSSTWFLRELAKRTSCDFGASILFPCSTDYRELLYIAYIHYIEHPHTHSTSDLLLGEQRSHTERTELSTSFRRDPRPCTLQVCKPTSLKLLYIIRGSTAH